MNKKPVITVIGSASFDCVAFASRMPEVGETVKGDDFGMFPGGKGANQAVQVGRLGVCCYLAGMVGKDFMGKIIRKSLRLNHVKTSHLFIHPRVGTACDAIHVAGGQNRIIITLRANLEFTPDTLTRVEPIIQKSDVILLQLELAIPTVEHAIRMAKKHGKIVILNPAPYQSVQPEIIEMVDFLTPNYIEALAFINQTGKDIPLAELAQAIRAIKKQGQTIVTLGDQGAMLVTPEETLLIPAYQIQAVDETAAGDAFNGALAVAIARGIYSSEQTTTNTHTNTHAEATVRVIEAIYFANAAGAIATTRKGAQPSIASQKEITQFLKTHPKPGVIKL